MFEPEVTQPKDTVLKGLGVLLLLHLFQIPMAAFTGGISIFAWGVTQLLYVIPAAIVWWRKGNRNVTKGIIIGAAISFLLNATCAAIVLGTMGNMK